MFGRIQSSLEARMEIGLGRIGVWSGQLRRGDREQTRQAVAELESLGYGTIWMPGATGPEFFAIADEAVTRPGGVTSGGPAARCRRC
jgi:hypothetical protein